MFFFIICLFYISIFTWNRFLSKQFFSIRFVDVHRFKGHQSWLSHHRRIQNQLILIFIKYAQCFESLNSNLSLKCSNQKSCSNVRWNKHWNWHLNEIEVSSAINGTESKTKINFTSFSGNFFLAQKNNNSWKTFFLTKFEAFFTHFRRKFDHAKICWAYVEHAKISWYVHISMAIKQIRDGDHTPNKRKSHLLSLR